MFAYNPSVNDNSGQILAAGQVGAAQANAQMMGQIGQDIGGALKSLGAMYAEEKGMQAEAAGYDHIGEILGGSMFKDNPAVSGLIGNLRKEKNARMKIAGYNALFNMAGPISNSQMANRNAGIRENAPIMNAGLQGAERVAGGEGTVPLPDEPPLPVQDDSTLPPSQPRQPSPDALTAADAWYNQSKGNSGMIQSGAMRPFYR